MLFDRDGLPPNRPARLVMVMQAAVKLAVLFILAFILHNQPISANSRALIYSILGLAMGWEGAVIFYRLITVWRG